MSIKLNALIMLVTASLSVFSACRSSKDGVSSGQAVGTSERSVTLAQSRQAFCDMADSYGAWDRLRMPMTVRVKSPKSVSVSGTVEMQRDKSILLSLKFFGMEVGNMYVTQDSVTVIDKINKCYVAENLGGLLGGFPVTVSNVQDMLLGRAFLLGENTITASHADEVDLGLVDGGTGWMFVPRVCPRGVEYGFTYSALSELLALIVKCGDKEPVTCMYGRQQSSASGPVARSVSVRATAGKTVIDASIEWNFDKARWNNDVVLRTVSVPYNYRRIPACDLPKIFSTI